MSTVSIAEDSAGNYSSKHEWRSRTGSEDGLEEHMMGSFAGEAEYYDSEDTLLSPQLPGDRKRVKYQGQVGNDGWLSRFIATFVRAVHRKRRTWARIAQEPWNIKLRLIFIIGILTLSLVLAIRKYRYRPHLKPSEWRRHCASQPPLSVEEYVRSEPVGILVGVMTTATDSAAARRMEIRQSWASHWASRGRWEEGRVWTPEELALHKSAGIGFHNVMMPTSRAVVRFVMGRPEPALRHRIKEEMDEYNDIIIVPIKENVNDGKTFAFFDWSFKHALVPPPSQNNETAPFHRIPVARTQGSELEHHSPPENEHGRLHGWARLNAFEARPPASHDPKSAEGAPFVNKNDWVRPEYVVKAHDDSFLMLAELEARLRTLPRKGVYWGYRVQAQGAELQSGVAYALSWDVVGHVSTYARRKQVGRPRPAFWRHREQGSGKERGSRPRPPPGRGRRRNRYQNLALSIYGPEDAMTALWMKEHGDAWGVTWYSEQCWIYDHPKAGTVSSRGFLFPLEARKIIKEWTQFVGANTTVSEEEGREQSGVSDVSRPEFHRLHDPAYSTVMRAHLRHSDSMASSWPSLYSSPLPNLHELAGGNPSMKRSMELDGLVEGSAVSMVVPGTDLHEEISRRWTNDMQVGWKGLYMLDASPADILVPLGGTVVVHYVKSSDHWRECADILLSSWDRERPVKDIPP